MHGAKWRRRLALPVCLMLPLCANPVPQSAVAAAPGQAQKAPEKAQEKETLDYAIEWRLVSAGRAKMILHDPVGENAPRRELKLHLESTGLVSKLFHVNDDYTANSTENYCSESTFMNSHEAGRDRETRVFYDSAAHKAYFREHDLTRNTVKTSETDVLPCVHDVVTGLYYLRTLPLEPGKSVTLPVSNGKKSAGLKIECQRREEIKTPLGLRKTLLYEIFAFNNVLYQRSGHIHVWLTDDGKRVPVQIEIRLQFTIGTITLRLDKEDRS